MQEVEGLLIPNGDNTVIQFSPGASHYTIPKDYWANVKYRVETTGNLKSADGVACTAYAHNLAGRDISHSWAQRTDGWWTHNNVSTFGWPLTQMVDAYGAIPSYLYMQLYPQVEIGPEQYAGWWTGPASPSAIRFTYESVDPSFQLWVKLRYGIGDTSYYVMGPFSSQEDIDMQPLYDLATSQDGSWSQVSEITAITANANPFDAYSTALDCQFTVSNIEIFTEDEVWGWVDITNLNGADSLSKGWEVVQGYATWDEASKQWLSTGIDSPTIEEVWLQTTGGVFLDGHCPTKIRVWYTMEDLTSTDLPWLYFYPGLTDGIWQIQSGQIIDLDQSFYSIGPNGKYFNEMLEFDLYGYPGTPPFTVKKIEIYQKIPNTLTFTRVSFEPDQSPLAVDYIMPGYSFTRNISMGAIYNVQQEDVFAGVDSSGALQISPKGTLWAFEDTNGNPYGTEFNLTNVESLIFAPFVDAVNGFASNIVGLNGICKFTDLDPAVYVRFRFLWWQEDGGGGFTYERQIVCS